MEQADPAGQSKPDCQRRYRLAPYKRILRRAFSRQRWRDKTPLRRSEARALLELRRCAKTPWHAERMRELRQAAAERHRDRRRRLLRAIKQRRCGTPECNLRLGLHIASRRGIDAAQRSCMVELWTRESGWREWIWNTSGSGAYGIPQSLPASKLPPRGQPSARNGWRKAKAQIRWGIDYVRDRYRTFCNAVAFHDAHNWY